MTFVNHNDLSFSDAQAYCEWVQRREPARLAELVRWLRATDGPIEDLDASVESLVPLWTWFLGFVYAGLPGVEDDALVGWWTEPEPGQAADTGTVPHGWYEPPPAGSGRPDPLARRTQYAGEAIGHYLMLVCRRLDPDAHWVVHRETTAQRAAISPCQHHTGIAVTGSELVIWDALRNGVSGARDRSPRHVVPTRLRDVFFVHRAPELHPGAQPRGAPVLLDLPPGAVEPPRWTPSALSGEGQTPEGSTALPAVHPVEPATGVSDGLPLGEFEMINGPREGLDDPALLTPLDAQALARGLTQLGFRFGDSGGDRAPRAADLLQDDAQAVRDAPGVSMVAQAWVLDGALLGLFFEPLDATDTPAAQALTAAIGDLAASVGARLTASYLEG